MSQEMSGTKIVNVEAGGEFSLALSSDGAIFAWGSNENFALGDYTNVNRNTPRRVYADEILQFYKIVQIAVGQAHAIALSDTGKVFTWGKNTYGQLGDDKTENSLKPIMVNTNSIGRVAGISAGAHHSLLLTGIPTSCFNKTGAMACSFPNGRCIAQDTCQCIGYYEGKECEIPTYTCFGKPYDIACNAPYGGHCVSQDSCDCSPGYIGTECAGFTCYGKHGNASCSGHGTCDGVDICTCETGYIGEECEVPICYGKVKAAACSYPYGECVAYDKCECKGYTGDECTTPVCYEKTGSQACNYPHGICMGADDCKCEEGYAGDECYQVGCYGKPLTLACNYPYGYCVGPDECNCTEGYGGLECDPICYGSTGNAACSGRGTCVLPNVCDCQRGWWGYECEYPVCYGRYLEEACSGQGVCESPDNCICNLGYFANDCSKTVTESHDEIPIGTPIIDIYGKGFSPVYGDNEVELSMGPVTPKCTIVYASPTRLSCSVTDLTVGTLYATVKVNGFASLQTPIAVIVGNMSFTYSNDYIPGYISVLTLHGYGFSEHVEEMEVELSQTYSIPKCTVLASTESSITCAITNLVNGILYAKALRNNIPSPIEQVGIVDSLPPVAGNAKLLSDYSTNKGFAAQQFTFVLRLQWSEFYDEGCGIAHFEVAIFENETILYRPFTNEGSSTTMTIGGLSLSVGSSYSAHVRAVDHFGYMSNVVVTSPILIVSQPIIPIPFEYETNSTIEVNLPIFSTTFLIPEQLFEKDVIDYFELKPITGFDENIVDPVDSVARMIGFILIQPLARIDNSTIPGNETIPGEEETIYEIPIFENETIPDNSTIPGNDTIPDNSTIPGNGTIPDNSTIPGNGTIPDNSTEPGNGTIPDPEIPPIPQPGFIKPLQLSIEFTSVSHFLKPDDQLSLKYFDKETLTWKKVVENCSEEHSVEEFTDFANKIHYSYICNVTGQYALFLNV
jgi:hypothetical protein